MRHCLTIGLLCVERETRIACKLRASLEVWVLPLKGDMGMVGDMAMLCRHSARPRYMPPTIFQRLPCGNAI